MKCKSGLVVPVNEKEKLCRHGCTVAVARFATSEGCAVFPEDAEQDLCVQHIFTWGFRGDAKPLVIYVPELFSLISDQF